MFKSRRLSSESSLPPPDSDDAASESSDDLMGSQSRLWLMNMGALGIPLEGGEVDAVGRDGLCVDYHFPVGKLEMEGGVRWMRPKELFSSPKFIVDGASRLDICQGKLSDCWVLSAIASLANYPELLKKVVPLNQSFQDGYNGRFSFRFWQYGQWEEVRIDDFLPTYNNKLIYLSSPERHEFWSSLLEKAYAKLKGGYRALELGYPHEAMVDMTGGVTEVFSLPLVSKDLPELLRNLLAKGALINCANGKGEVEKKNEMGIMYRHAYSLTAVEKVKTTDGFKDLVRILNPWGHTEWLGAWSDNDRNEWTKVSAEEQKRLGRVRQEDGEFWMSVSDFNLNFDAMEVCHLTEAQSAPGSDVSPWKCVMHHGAWLPNITAGGPPDSNSFWQNPQFLLVLSEVAGNSKSSCSFVVAVMQKYQRRRGVHLSVGLHIYQAHPRNAFLSAEDLRKGVLCWTQHSTRREVVLRSSLPPGRYIIIPSTFEPNQQGEFLLRVLTEPGSDATPAHKPTPLDVLSIREHSLPHQAALPSDAAVRKLFHRHSNKEGLCKPERLQRLLTEALQGGVLAGSERYLSLEHCKSLVVLMDSQGKARLNWSDFQLLWDKIRKWTDIFLVYDTNKTHHLEYKEVEPALKAAGIMVNDLVMQLVGLRYTESDLTISYPGFLFLLMKMESMIHKFQVHDIMGLGTITISYTQWLHMTLYS
ncbi:calpain-9-like [Xiphophorus hellerii]|uniref:calpain-9-like n=1 Tax=Xiphophorus hellerii TaxID=8084 RepID=UPI0013B4188F|nr:calpain-9-like [Xiphophorus hellerii]